MRKPDKAAIMAVPVGPELTPQNSGAGESISDLASRLTGAAKSIDASPRPQAASEAISMPFSPSVPATAPQAPTARQKGQMSLTGDLETLDALKALSKEQRNTNAEMVAEMMEIYTQLRALGEPQRYSAAEMLDVLMKR